MESLRSPVRWGSYWMINPCLHFPFINKPRVMGNKGINNRACRQIPIRWYYLVLQGDFRDEENTTKSFYNQRSKYTFAINIAGDIAQPFLISEVTTCLKNSDILTNVHKNYFQGSDNIKWKRSKWSWAWCWIHELLLYL